MWMVFPVTIWLIVISIADARRCRVPVWLLGAGGIFGAMVLIFRFCSGAVKPLGAVGGMLPGVLLLVLALATRKAGYGDGLVLFVLGMIWEGGKVLTMFGISLFLISIWSLALLVLRRAGRNTELPYLPFLTVAWLLAGVW